MFCQLSLNDFSLAHQHYLHVLLPGSSDCATYHLLRSILPSHSIQRDLYLGHSLLLI